MNILFVDQFSQPGGAQQCLMELLPEVRARGWNPFLLAPGDGELVRRCHDSGIPVDSLPLGTYSSGGKTALDALRFAQDVARMKSAIRGAIAAHRIDLVFVNGPRALPAATGTDLPVMFHAHSPVGGRLPRIVAERSVRSMRATVIAVSEFVARRYPGARIIYNGVPDYGEAGRSFGRRAPRIGIAGRIAPEKGHLDFVRMAHAIAGQTDGRGARFFVYGERLFSAARYDRAVRAAAAGAPIEFCGWKNDIGAMMRDLDILVVPSDPSEAATRVIMEAFSAGTPVVAYRCGGIPELVEDGRTGLLAEWPDREALTRKVLSLITDPAKMEQLSAAGRREWDRRFRVRRFQTSVCEVMENVAACAISDAPSSADCPTQSMPLRGRGTRNVLSRTATCKQSHEGP